MAHLNSLPEDATLLDIFAAYPQLAGPALTLAQQILRGPSELSVQQREFLFAFGSGLNACHFCYGSHTAAAGALGADQNAIRAAVVNIDQAPVEEKFKPLLRYVKKLTEMPSRVTRGEADAVRAAGWSDNALHDAIAVCSLNNFYNRWVDGCGADASDNFLAKSGQMLADRGYDSFLTGEKQEKLKTALDSA
jgi:uncharacterized peroxidase-related enzyme